MRPAAAALAVAVVARAGWAWRTARATTGVPPGVRTEDGVLLHTEVEGRADAPLTVVLVHGLAARLEEFDALPRALGERARVVRFDLRGHGRSGWRGPISATPDRLGRDVERVIETTAAGRVVVLVGHSLGGMAVLALIRRRPELVGDRVAGVALLSTSAGRLARLALPPALARAAVRSGVASTLLWLLWAAAPLADLAHPFRTGRGRRWLRSKLFGRAPVPPTAVEQVQSAWTHTPQALAAALYPAMVAYDAGPALDALGRVPTLVLTGTDDATIPPRHSDRLARALGPRARLVTVPGAGHMVDLTHPDAVGAALNELLDRIEADASPGEHRTSHDPVV